MVYDTFGDGECGEQRRGRTRAHTWVWLAAVCGAAALCWSTSGVLQPSPAPRWLREVRFGLGSAADREIRAVIASHRVGEADFWALPPRHIERMFPETVGFAVAVERAVASKGQPVNGTARAQVSDPEGHPDLYSIDTQTEWVVFYSAVFAFAVVVMAVLTRRELNDQFVESRFSDETILRMRPLPNIYRMVAVVDWNVIRGAGRSPHLFVMLATLTAWMQIYIPWRTMTADMQAVTLEGLKTLSWYPAHIGSILTSLSALVTVGVIFMKSVQMSLVEETQRVYHLLSYRAPDEHGALGVSFSATRRGSLPMLGGSAKSSSKLPGQTIGQSTCCGCVPDDEGPRYCCCVPACLWEAIWSLTSLFTCYWSGFTLSMSMILTIASYDGDASTFVLSAMKIFFLMDVDEKILGCFPKLANLYVEDAKKQTYKDPAYASMYEVLPRLSAFGSSACDMLLAVGLFVLIVTYWENGQGNVVGVGAWH